MDWLLDLLKVFIFAHLGTALLLPLLLQNLSEEEQKKALVQSDIEVDDFYWLTRKMGISLDKRWKDRNYWIGWHLGQIISDLLYYGALWILFWLLGHLF